MIPDYCIAEWRQEVPWIQDYQVEQDLIITRALVSLYENPVIRDSLVFRGGTALHKLFITPAARYSEDIDLVQIRPEPIGEVIDEIRENLVWLGDPIRKITERGVKLIYRYNAIDGSKKRLKIEINTTEHFYVHDLIDYEFKFNNSWYSGKCTIRTYQLNELMGTKLRALYQRRKGRDLFDLWIVLKNKLIDTNVVIDVFLAHGDRDGTQISRRLFEKNLTEKLRNLDFQQDTFNLLAEGTRWSFGEAFEAVNKELISLLS
ncbi:MAG: nucleotidyl transferase AbiEii/AbiGii toxin family protein [Gammaproteobacteria bacterium]|nr:nucleotidyl transferase AbiEii/AbiGii toxin family protein [Gammaproteobacteria bacterium]